MCTLCLENSNAKDYSFTKVIKFVVKEQKK